jgi:hypothetical protein
MALACLEGFHIHAAYRMAKMHKPKRGPGRTWIYPRSVDVLQECGPKTMEEYIGIRWQTIAVYMATPQSSPNADRASKRGERYHAFGGGNSP